MTVKRFPNGYHTLIPYLIVKGADQLIEFVKQSFNAREIRIVKQPDGVVKNAEILVDNSMLMHLKIIPTLPLHFYMYVDNIDMIYRQAIQAGALSLMEPADQFYGERTSGVSNPYGNTWWITTHTY